MHELADRIANEHLRSVRVKDEYIAAECPFHEVKSGTQFWIHRATGAWGCFSCGARSGNLADLLKGLGVHKSRVFALLEQEKENRKKDEQREKIRRQRKAKAEFTGIHILPESLLGIFDWCPTRLLEEGFSEEILLQHSIGFDRARERITFPIRDIKGQLIGISGRTVVNGVLPKYKVYQGWHTDWEGKHVPGELGEWFPDYSSTDIRNHLWRGQFVYDRLYSGRDNQLIVVEGYKAALWLVQHGYDNTVAIMGARMSFAQERLIRSMGTETWVFLDNNEAGRTGTEDMCWRLGNSTFPVYRCRYPEWCDEATQPDGLDEEELQNVLEGAVRAARRKRKWSK
jgi:DNA primase